MDFKIQSANMVGQTGAVNRPRSELAIKVKSSRQEDKESPAADPKTRDKIALSKSSLEEELLLVKSNKRKKDLQKAALDDLQSSLTRVQSVLYMAAAAVSFDPKSLKAVQKEIVNELRKSRSEIIKVDLPQLKGTPITKDDLNPDLVHIESKQDVKDVAKIVDAASEAISKLKQEIAPSEKDKMTSKALEIAHQNASAALTTYDPKDIFNRANSVVQDLKSNHPQLLDAQGKIGHESVINLIG